jgi:hypothetical protein
MTLHIWGANVFAVQIAAGYVSLSKPRGFDAPLMFAVRFGNMRCHSGLSWVFLLGEKPVDGRFFLRSG